MSVSFATRIAERYRAEEAERAAERDERRRRRLRDHAVAGALLYAFATLVLAFIDGAPFGAALLAAIAVAPVGALVGRIISARAYGLLGGALVGMGVVGGLVLALHLVAGGLTVGGAFRTIGASMLLGGIPGGLLGFHVEQDA